MAVRRPKRYHYGRYQHLKCIAGLSVNHEKLKEMKKVLLGLCIVAAALFQTAVLANDKESEKNARRFESVLFPTIEGKVRVNILNPDRQLILVQFKTMIGETVHEDFINRKQRKAAINYDVSRLLTGTYQVRITDGKHIETRHFNIAEGESRLARKVSLQP